MIHSTYNRTTPHTHLPLSINSQKTAKSAVSHPASPYAVAMPHRSPYGPYSHTISLTRRSPRPARALAGLQSIHDGSSRQLASCPPRPAAGSRKSSSNRSAQIPRSNDRGTVRRRRTRHRFATWRRRQGGQCLLWPGLRPDGNKRAPASGRQRMSSLRDASSTRRGACVVHWFAGPDGRGVCVNRSLVSSGLVWPVKR